MASFYVILFALLIQIRAVLGLIYLVRVGSSDSVSILHWHIETNFDTLSQKGEGYAFYVTDPSGQTSTLGPDRGIGLSAGRIGYYRILAGFPPGSSQPKWDHTFYLQGTADDVAPGKIPRYLR